ncbi:MAG: NAD(P) transhydrogenase subunit alpha [Flavobacterium sp.]
MLEFISANEAPIYFIVLCIFLGVEIISNVPAILHTPLMSGANAIHGVILAGAIIVMYHVPSNDYVNLTLGFLAVLLGTLNISGGFFITGRILSMFSKKTKK